MQLSPKVAVPSRACLALHDKRLCWNSLEGFLPSLSSETRSSFVVEECLEAIRLLGILEPITGLHLPPKAIKIEGNNFRESIEANQLISRHRAVLLEIDRELKKGKNLANMNIFIAEAFAGFSTFLPRLAPHSVCRSSLKGSYATENGYEDICRLSFSSSSFDLLVYNDSIGYAQSLGQCLSEALRVLKPGGRLLATFPFAYGQQETIVKTIQQPHQQGKPSDQSDASFSYQIPGWSILKLLQDVGFSDSKICYTASWKHGVLGADLPGVFVLEACR
jgi:SAM-dependent methyltransferase